MAEGTRRILATGLPFLFASACLSPVPLDPTPTIAVDRQLIGEWNCHTQLPSPETETAVLTVTEAGPKAYSLVLDDPESGLERYEAYASRVADLTLFNIRSAGNTQPLEPHPWVFGHVRMESNALHLATVSVEAPPTGLSEAVWREAIEQWATQPAFIDIGTCRRAQSRQ